MPTWVKVVLALSFVAGVSAQERFTIERVEIRNARQISARVLAAETLLREGSEVSEDDVRAAVRRLTRLPFVFAADYTLENGSDQSRRIVAISVRENHRYWFLVDGRFAQEYEPVDALDYDFPDPTADWKHAAAGARWLFGDGGVAHFGMTVLRSRHLLRKNYSAYELGYTRHRILGTPLFATVIVRTPVDSVEERTFTPEVVVGFPLSATQTVKLEYEDTSFRNQTVEAGGTAFRRLQAERILAASWTFDTTDEPFVPMRGSFVKVEPFVWMGDRASFSGRPGGFVSIADHSTETGFELVAEQHWPLSEVSSVFGGVLAGWSTIDFRRSPSTIPVDEELRTSFEVIEGGYARKIRRSHVEVSGRLVLNQVSDDDDESLARLPETSYEVSAAWTRRSPRYTLRLGFAYVD